MFSTTNVQYFKKTQNILKEIISFLCHFYAKSPKQTRKTTEITRILYHIAMILQHKQEKRRGFYQKTSFLKNQKERRNNKLDSLVGACRLLKI